ncbi:hypothetical protein FEM03_19725 [Phragmitibacter flavus]|uniref:Transcriptional regulator AbiEi antitoxin N-terminal domain-containing protein n=1 Tax=Phragmitibacter flavus TaxID=2576071 RepID=A0A5R8K9W3_9BACT|nr:type IV toxin-antitoxin system AbiEi family antitoxin domain-containing protein [Phragmitibacter flavus]TLD69098.1 hypothetical protein FEM03_19725 [Phragmitibacter flavus]
MPLTNRPNRIKLLHGLPRGKPVSTVDLRAIGVSPALASHYVKSGWLLRLGRGIFMFPQDTLERDACLKFLGTQIPGLHVAGKTALSWRGVRIQLPARERLVLWADEPGKLPLWFTQRFAARYTSSQLFHHTLPKHHGLEPLPESPDGPLVSVPERALLEMLSDVGLRQSIEEARQIMETLRSLRNEVLDVLLEHCTRIKVIRICLQWGEEMNLPWADEARKRMSLSLEARGSKSRWTARLKDGTTLILKP